jgi:Ferritin-like
VSRRSARSATLGPATRARLLSLLSEACELEHALSCSYLFAAFSLKKELDEGIDWEQQQEYRRWASEVFHVAAEEMLHLAQAWNLLTAVGGSPYYARPNFPQAAKHFPLPVALLLRKFDAATIERFTYYENPAHENPEKEAPLPRHGGWPIDESFRFDSVGALYGEIRQIIETLDDFSLFIGTLDQQVTRDLVDFPNLISVTNRESALAAIEMITEQGEGNPGDREDSHYDVFCDLLKKANKHGSRDPARPVGDNPYVRARRDQMVPHMPEAFQKSGIAVTPITHPVSLLATDLFDDVYVAMLQALAYVFSNATHEQKYLKVFASAALRIMMMVVRPLGEAITLMPSGSKNVNAGPTFAMTRHAPLPAPAQAALLVFTERLEELTCHAEELYRIAPHSAELAPIALAHLHSVQTNTGFIARSCREALGT